MLVLQPTFFFLCKTSQRYKSRPGGAPGWFSKQNYGQSFGEFIFEKFCPFKWDFSGAWGDQKQVVRVGGGGWGDKLLKESKQIFVS